VDTRLDGRQGYSDRQALIRLTFFAAGMRMKPVRSNALNAGALDWDRRES
jgi:hypothetical protein